VAELASFLPLIAIVAVFWLLVIRPASKRQKNLSQMQAALEPGNRVMLSSGIFGTIRTVHDDRIRVEIAPGVEIEAVRGAVGSVDDADAGAPGSPRGSDTSEPPESPEPHDPR
jgi:preprotein translocase subunit YajC